MLKQRPRGAGSVANAAVDTSRRSIPFVARTCRIAEDGLHAELERGGDRRLAWEELARAAARQLPPDPPYDRAVFADLAPAQGPPIRLFPSTIVNYSDLPDGAAQNSRENFRRLVAYARRKNPEISLDPDSAPFFEEGKAPPRLLAIKQLSSFDSRYR